MSQQIILLIQEDPADARIVHEALSHSTDGSSFKVEWVRGCNEGLERLAREGLQRRHRIAAILVDLSLPDSHGIETFDKLFDAVPQIPILVLAGSLDEDIAKSAVQRGAQDYLLKQRIDSYLLPKTVDSMIERASNAEALFEEKERAQVTLNSIGDAVMSTDVWCQVTYLNVVAEGLTGWSCEDAAGHPLEEVFHIIDSTTRQPVPNPMAMAIRENKTVGLTPNCVLIRRDGHEAAIEDSAAPIHDRRGRVTGAVMVFHDVTTARALSLRMSYLARHDSLTDLPNRILLNDRLTQAITLAYRHQQKLALLYLDVDRFKHINDALGHAVGDRLLQSVAQRLFDCVRTSDTVSRQGGDEFVILLTETKQARDAAVIAEKILLALAAPHRIDQHELHLTASIGIVTYPDDGMDADTLMKNADFAMYHAKDFGRNNFQFFKADMNVRAIERQSLENGLRHALERHEFVLYYQPKMNLDTGSIIGVEALIRWRHPTRGLVSPAQFIPVAEECGFIVTIGRWVLREACCQARKWQKEGLPAMRIAINISAVELRAKGFVAYVRQILTETGLEARYLELELTETFLMQDSRSTAAVLRELKDMGIHLALDDFGTGYSSLSYVKRFPIDTLKIDQSFVRDLATDADDASIVSAVISMGKSLHMRVVAEGVETQEQLEFLREHGCPFGQGFYFSPPVGAKEFTQLLGHSVRSVAETANILLSGSA
jgi:diguanylate cyclase (GGDEF)-like protein/PAS domain S-box-containing protein